MTIGKDSRYKNSDVIAIEQEDGRVKRFIAPRFGLSPEDVGVNFRVHTYVKGERLQDIARRYYGRDELWWYIAEVNGILYPFEIEDPNDTGKSIKLIIPSQSEVLAR